MKTISKTLIIALCALSSLSVSAHGMHKSKPLSFEELPNMCQIAMDTFAEKTKNLSCE